MRLGQFKNRALAITFCKQSLHMLKISNIEGLVIKLKPSTRPTTLDILINPQNSRWRG
jgi:hypothetical protein